MDAKELTKYILDKVDPRLKELEEWVDYLKQDNQKLRRIVDDYKWDIKDLQEQIKRLRE